MNLLVLLKQIPDEEEKDQYQDVNLLNDSDKNVLKEALDFRDFYGGSVCVMLFGPLYGEEILKEAFTYGIDRAILVWDEDYKNQDIAGVAKVIAKAIETTGSYDLVLCGRQALDGDAGHMASITSCYLGYPLIAYSKEFNIIDKKIQAVCESDDSEIMVKTLMPAMVLSVREKNHLRFPSIPDIMKTYDGTYKIERIGKKELQIEPDLRKMYQIRCYYKIMRDHKRKMLSGEDERESAQRLLQVLREQHVIQGGEG